MIPESLVEFEKKLIKNSIFFTIFGVLLQSILNQQLMLRN